MLLRLQVAVVSVMMLTLLLQVQTKRNGNKMDPCAGTNSHQHPPTGDRAAADTTNRRKGPVCPAVPVDSLTDPELEYYQCWIDIYEVKVSRQNSNKTPHPGLEACKEKTDDDRIKCMVTAWCQPQQA